MTDKIPDVGWSETDRIVFRWAERQGISMNQVTGYTITRTVGKPSTISVDMLFDDSPERDEQ